MGTHSGEADALLASLLISLRGRRFMVFGNPGVGKSTLLNAFFGGKAAFESGVSFGGGLTRNMCWKKTEEGVELCDTPGLADAKMYKECAAEISKALREEDPFSLFFVVRLEAGRVVNEDVTTIKAVLEALGQPVHFGVVFNKVARGLMKMMNSDQSKSAKVEELLNEQLPCQPQECCYLPYVKSLDCEDMAVGEGHAPLLSTVPVELLSFLSHLVDNRPDLLKVKAVESDYEKFKQAVEEQALQAEQLREQERRREEENTQKMKRLEEEKREKERKQREEAERKEREQQALVAEAERQREAARRAEEERIAALQAKLVEDERRRERERREAEAAAEREAARRAKELQEQQEAAQLQAAEEQRQRDALLQAIASVPKKKKKWYKF